MDPCEFAAIHPRPSPPPLQPIAEPWGSTEYIKSLPKSPLGTYKGAYTHFLVLEFLRKMTIVDYQTVD